MDTGGAGKGTGVLPDTGPVPSPGIAGYRWLRIGQFSRRVESRVCLLLLRSSNTSCTLFK
jgi:hypothetical protein